MRRAWTWRQSASATEYTATVCSPSSRHARITRTAISPRLATSTLVKPTVGVLAVADDPAAEGLCARQLRAALALGRGVRSANSSPEAVPRNALRSWGWAADGAGECWSAGK